MPVFPRHAFPRSNPAAHEVRSAIPAEECLLNAAGLDVLSSAVRGGFPGFALGPNIYPANLVSRFARSHLSLNAPALKPSSP